MTIEFGERVIVISSTNYAHGCLLFVFETFSFFIFLEVPRDFENEKSFCVLRDF
jgi:hypothetical protein